MILAALRAAKRDRLYFVLNMGGLAIAMTVVLLLLMFVRDQLSYDTWLTDHERVYRLETKFTPADRGVIEFAIAISPVVELLPDDFPNEVETTARLSRQGNTVKVGDRTFNQAIDFVDPTFFDIVDLPVVAGDRDAVMNDNAAIAITETMARTYFGDEDPIGKTLTVGNKFDYTVRAVLKDLPHNSHMNITHIVRMARERMANPAILDTWNGVTVHGYVKLRPGFTAAQVEAGLPAFFRRRAKPTMPGFDADSMGAITEMRLLPVADTHLHSGRRANMKPGGNINTVIAYGLVSALILIIATINYINLTTARSSTRSLEIGLRKTLGATRGALIRQIVGESLAVSLFSAALALGLAWLLSDWFAALVGLPLSTNLMFDGEGLLIVVGAALTAGLLGGLYPAFLLSKPKPALILHDGTGLTSGRGLLRGVLVVIQFAVSIALITATLIIRDQTNYARTIDLGFHRDNMLILGGLNRPAVAASAEAIKNEIERLPGVTKVAQSTSPPPIIGSPNNIIQLPDMGPDESIVIEQILVDSDYFDTYGISEIAGRLYSEDRPGDILAPPEEGSEDPPTQSVVINENAVRVMGFGSPEAALGKTFWALVPNSPRALTTVVGVVPDAYYHSLYIDLTPMMFVLRRSGFNAMTVRLDGSNLQGTLSAIDEAWAGLVPDEPIARTFMDQNFAAQYADDARAGRLMLNFAFFTILIACLGLFGLASFTIERRTKELAIRRVLGASVGHLVTLLVVQFSKPVIAANLFAALAAWWVMRDWLENFAYRIELTATPFLVAGIAAMLVAVLVVSGQSARAARVKPVELLRYE